VVVKEVADSTSRNRYLDYMVINLWESRGQSIIGFEVKSHRNDWLKEMKSPAKQELHAPYCDYFYLLTTSENVAKVEEIPENWGWMIVKGDKLFTLKKAPKQQSKPMSRSLMVAIIRRAFNNTDFVHKDLLEKEIEVRVENKIASKAREYEREYEYNKQKTNQIIEAANIFKEASGLDILVHRSWDDTTKRMGEIVKMVMQNQIEDYVRKLNSMKLQLETFDRLGTTTLEKINNLLDNLKDESSDNN
jgi:hypothetical protein